MGCPDQALERAVRRGLPDQRQTRAGLLLRALVAVEAQAQGGAQRRRNAPFVLRKDAHTVAGQRYPDVACRATGVQQRLVDAPVVLCLQPDHQLVVRKRRRQQTHFAAGPVPICLGPDDGAVALGAAKAVRPGKQAPAQVQRVRGEALFVLQLQQVVAIGLVLPRHQRIGLEKAGRVVLAPVAMHQLEHPRPARNPGEELVVALAVQAAGNARDAREAVVEEAILSLRLCPAGRQQHVEPVVQQLAPADRDIAQALGPLVFHRHAGAADPRSGARHDVDHPEHGVLAIDGATGPGQEFDALDHFQVQRKFASRRRAVKDRVVDAVAVDRDQDAHRQVARQSKTAHSQVSVLAIVGGVHTRQAGQRLRQRSPAEVLDVLARDHTDRRADLALLLLIL